jgi:hypothetical protein
MIRFSTGVCQNVVTKVPDVAASFMQLVATVRATVWIVMVADVRKVPVLVDMDCVVSRQQSPELYGDKGGGVAMFLEKKDGAANKIVKSSNSVHFLFSFNTKFYQNLLYV